MVEVCFLLETYGRQKGVKLEHLEEVKVVTRFP